MRLFDYERKWYGLFSDNRLWKPSILQEFKNHAEGFHIDNDGDVEKVRTYSYEKILKMKIKEDGKYIFGCDV